MENFIPLKPEYLSTDWLAMVINHYREKKELSPIRWVLDLALLKLSSLSQKSKAKANGPFFLRTPKLAKMLHQN